MNINLLQEYLSEYDKSYLNEPYEIIEIVNFRPFNYKINVYGLHCKVFSKGKEFSIFRHLDKKQFDKFIRKKKLNKLL